MPGRKPALPVVVKRVVSQGPERASLMQFVKTRRHVMQEDNTTATKDSQSKDEFYRQLSVLTDAMSAAHGRDFTVGTLILSARFIVQKKEQSAASSPATSTT
jgi:triphosphoribosyl-dephospho-CoA synthetase